MIKQILLSSLLVALVSCGKYDSPDSSNNQPTTTINNGPNTTALAKNCGDLNCDSRTEYCFKEVKSANVIDLAECGPLPTSSCTLWQYDLFGKGQILSSSCVQFRSERLACGGQLGVAADALRNNPQLCRTGVDANIGCHTQGTITVSCFQ